MQKFDASLEGGSSIPKTDKKSVEGSTNVILVNNLSAIAIHALMIPLFALSVFFFLSAIGALWILCFALYAWMGYRHLRPSEKSPLFSVAVLFLLLILVSLFLASLFTSRGEEFLIFGAALNIWMPAFSMIFASFFQDSLPSAHYYIQIISAIIAAFIPPLALSLGMTLKKLSMEGLSGE